MRASLPFSRRSWWSSFLLFTALLTLGLARPAAATHLLGGELRYRYLDATGTTPGRPFRYELTFSLYINCNTDPRFGVPSAVPCGRPVLGVVIYDRGTGQQIFDDDNPGGLTVTDPCTGQPSNAQPGTFPFTITSDSIITPVAPPGCPIEAPCSRVVSYTRIVDLPLSFSGYYAVYGDRARNNSVTNLVNAGNQGQVIQLEIAPPAEELANTSPVFSDVPVLLLCANDTVTLINNAFDAEGDRLVYRLFAPYQEPSFPGATYVNPTGVTYAAGYNATQPFGSGGIATIDALTGQTTYMVPVAGDYVVGVQVSEFRNINGTDVLLSTVERELQLIVGNCSTVPGGSTFPPPTLTFPTGQTITIDEGQTAQFSVSGAAAAGTTNNITLSVASPLLDGAGGFNATFNGLPGVAPNQPITFNGPALLSGTFQFTAPCGAAGVYNVNVTVRDNDGCPAKSDAKTYLLTVRAPAAPTAIGGPATVCPNTTATYTATGAPATTASYQWTVTGGTIQGSATGATITVRWTTVGTGSVSAKAISALGCPSDELSRSVEVFAGVTATVGGLNAGYCVNTTAPGTTLTGTPAGGTYTITGPGGTTNLVGGVFTPRVAGTFQIVYAVNDPNGCAATSAAFTVVVSPLPTVALAASLPATVCTNDLPITLSGTVNGAVVTTGITIDGTPATVFNPALLTAGPHVVTLTGTGAGNCTASATRTITVNAAPTVLLTGLQTSYCQNATAVPLTATANGAAITGANAVFTIDGAAATQLNPATLTVGFHVVGVRGTGPNGCRDTDSLRVEIKALPTVAITGLQAAYCRDAAPVTLAGTIDAAPGGAFTIDGTAATVFNPATLSVGAHVVELRGTGLNGCAASITQTVTVNPLPVVRIVAPTTTTFCLDAPAVTLTGNAAGQFFVGASPTAVTSFLPSALGVGTHIIRFTRTETATGCTNDTTLTITIRPLPVVAITGLQAAYCRDATPVTLAGTIDGAAGGTFTIDGTTATVLNPATLTPGPHRIILTGTGANGCSTSDTATVEINALPTVAITGLQAAYCAGTPAVTLAGTVNTSTTLGAVTFTVNGTAATSFDPATLAPGTYTVVATGTLTATGCRNTTTQTVTINALPAVAITGLNAAYCVSAAAVPLTSTLTGGAGAVTYTVNGAAATSLSPALLGPGTYTVVATGTVTATGCQNTATQTVTINALPTVAILGLNAAYCQGAPAVTLAGTVSGSGAITFTVNGTAGAVFDPSTLAPGTYTVIATGTAPNTCQNTVTQTVVINARPTVAITGLNPTYCVSAPAVTLAATVTGGAGTSTFTVNGAPVTSFDPATLGVGTYTVVATGTVTATGCQNTTTQTVTINALPTVAILGLNAAYCQGEPTVPLTGIVNGSTGTVSFTVNGAPATSFDPATLAPGSYTVIITGTDGNTCANTATQTVVINPKPTGDQISGPPSVCPGLTGVTYTAVGATFSTYRWRVVGGTISGAATGPTVSVDWGAANANAQVQLVSVAALTGCPSDTITFAVRINQVLATQTPTGTASFCVNGGTQTFTVPQPSPGSVYNWAITPAAAGTVTAGQGTATITVSFSQPGVAALVVTETSATPLANCFGTSAPLNVTVLAAPDATLAIQASAPAVCATGAPVTFTLPGAAGSTYQWLVDGAVQAGSTTGTFSLPATTAGTYLIGVQETNSANCVGPVITTSLTVNAVPSAATIAGPASICPQGLSQSYSVTGLAGSTFQWTVTGGTISAGQGTGTVTVDFDGATTPTLRVVETSSAGCAGPAAPIALTLDVAAPTLSLASVDEAQPANQINLVLGGLNAQPGTQLLIQRRVRGTGAFTQVGTVASPATTFTDNADANAAAYDYRVDLTNACGTVLESVEHTTVRVEAVGNEASGDVTLTWNEYRGLSVGSYQVLRKNTTGGYDVLGAVLAGQPTMTFVATGVGREAFEQTFRIRVLPDAGSLIAFSNEAKVTFTNELRTYNIITPDGDNLNDRFVIDNATLYPTNELAVFNRWGREVYRRKNYDNSWGGGDLPAGTYYYLFTANGQSFKSWLEIVK